MEGIAPIALTGTFLDPSGGTVFGGLAFNPRGSSYFAAYVRWDTKSEPAWSLIY
jgi:hypothetical protein